MKVPVIPKFVKTGEVAIAVLEPTKQMCVESFKDFPPLGRFTIRDNRKTVGVGVIMDVVKADYSIVSKKK